jgi:hypothetical protein
LILPIGLRTKGSRKTQVAPEQLPNGLLKGVNEARIFVEHNGEGEAEMRPYMGEKQLNCLLCRSCLGARNEHGHFGETTHHHKNIVVFPKGHGQAIKKINKHGFLRTRRNG